MCRLNYVLLFKNSTPVSNGNNGDQSKSKEASVSKPSPPKPASCLLVWILLENVDTDVPASGWLCP